MKAAIISRLRGDRGFTLVELLVSMTILAIIMALITGSTIFLQRSVRQTEQRFDDLAQARLAMDATTKWLRGAVTIDRDDTPHADRDPFTQAMSRRVDFITNVTTGGDEGVPQRVRLEVINGDQLQETVWSGRLNPQGKWTQRGPPRRRIIARGVIEDEPFTFYDAIGDELVPSGDSNLNEAQREAIRYVGIDIGVQQNPRVEIPPSELSSRVRLPNQFYYDAEENS